VISLDYWFNTITQEIMGLNVSLGRDFPKLFAFLCGSVLFLKAFARFRFQGKQGNLFLPLAGAKSLS